MARLLGGAIASILGGGMGIYAFYYAWASNTPEFPPETYQRYQFISMVLGLLAVLVIAYGMYAVVSSIKRMNREYRDNLNSDDQENRPSKYTK